MIASLLAVRQRPAAAACVLLGCFAALAVAACAGRNEPPLVPIDALPPATEGGVSPPPLATAAPTHAQPARPEPSAPPAGPATVRCPGGEEIAVRRVAPGGRSARSRPANPARSLGAVRADLRGVAVPVILPAAPELLERATILPSDDGYTAVISAGDFSLGVVATRLEWAFEGDVAAGRSGTPQGGVSVSDEEGVWTVLWSERGVAYAVDLECRDRSIPLCANERSVRAFVADFAILAEPAGIVRSVVTRRVLRNTDRHCLSEVETTRYQPPGSLTSGSGQGRADLTVYLPEMRFPILAPPAYANSQVWGAGGMHGGGGSQCSNVNYSYPWRDNFCETRGWDVPLCPGGKGHQGQDIRPGSCDPDTHWAVAVAAGTIGQIGSYSVQLIGNDGTIYRYLHMSNVQVATGDRIASGDRLGLVSNRFGGSATTVHLHFDVRMNIAGRGFTFVPPYASLVTSYQRLLGDHP